MKPSTDSTLRALFIVASLFLVPLPRAQEPASVEGSEPATASSAGESPATSVGTDLEITEPTDEAAGDPVAESDEAPVSEAEAVAPDHESEPAPPLPPPLPDLPPLPGDSSVRRASINDVVKIFDHGVVLPNEVAHDFVVIFGDGIIDGTVQGDAVVVLGDVKVNGRVRGDLVNVMGRASLGPEAVIEGELVAVGGRLNKDEAAIIRGNTTQVSFLPTFKEGQFEWVSTWIHSGLLMGRPLPHDQAWAWITAGVLLLIGLVIALIFRRATDATVAVLEDRPAAALLTGLVIFILSGPISFLLLVSVIGILILPFLILGVKIATVFGIIAIYRYSGQQMGLRSLPAAAFIVGGILFTLLYAVPVIGFLTLLVLSILGTGATCLAMVQGVRRETRTSSDGRVPMSPVSPTTRLMPTPSGPTSSDAVGAEPGPETEPSGLGPDEATPIRPEAPEDPLMAERVGFWPRLGATALDFILVAGLIWFTGLDWLLPFAWIGYHVVFWTWRQTTIGGIVMNLKVVRLDGRKLSFGIVAVRSLASIFSGVVIGLGFFWASWDDERQSWHDKIAGTTIVRVPKGTSLL